MEAKPMATVDFRISLPDELIHLSLEEQNELEKRIVRKMDRRLMPIIIVMYVVWL
jgi:glutaredoxin